MRIIAFQKNLDLHNPSVKIITIKNITIGWLFSVIGVPQRIIDTRWSSWLRAVLIYAKNLSEIKRIVTLFSHGGVQITKAKEAVNNIYLSGDLVQIKNVMVK